MGVPPDISYCLDCMADLHEIPGDVYFYLNNIKEDVVSWWDDLESRKVPNNYYSAHRWRGFCLDDYTKWRKNAPQIKRALATIEGIRALPTSIGDLTLAITHDVLSKTGDVIPTRNQIIKSMYVGKTQTLFFENFDFLFRHALIDFDGISVQDIKVFQDEIYDKRHRQYLTEFGYDVDFDRLKVAPKPKKALSKADRKIAVRSMKLLQSVLGPAKTKLFLGREHVEIASENFIFRVIRKPGKLHRVMTWDALDIQLYDKSGDFLANLCFYYDNMPVADQLTALILDIQSGNEKEVIRTGNLFRVTEKGKTNEVLLKFKDNEPKLLRNNGEFPMMESNLLGTPENELPMDAFIFGPTIPKNFDATLPLVKDALLSRLRPRFAFFQKFDYTLALSHKPLDINQSNV